MSSVVTFLACCSCGGPTDVSSTQGGVATSPHSRPVVDDPHDASSEQATGPSPLGHWEARCDVPCTEDLPLDCPVGLLDACLTRQAPVHTCVVPRRTQFQEQVSCGEPRPLTCPPGQVDACLTGGAPIHMCIPTQPRATPDSFVPCSPALTERCGGGQAGGCRYDGTPVPDCVQGTPAPPQVPCTQALALPCPDGQVDACLTNDAPVHVCVATSPSPASL